MADQDAEDYLGLNCRQARTLFHHKNSLAKLRRIVNEIIATPYAPAPKE